jgi:hypothetical protein
MRISRIRLAVLALTSGIVLGGCAYDTYGDPYGYGYGYGPRSSVSVGVGYGGGYGGYGYGGYGYGDPYGGYYGGYGGYGGYDPFGWFGDYYYPGSGSYVYDRSRTRHVWSGDQQNYWTQRRQQWQNHGGTTSSTGANWSGWDRSRSRDRNGTATNTGNWTRGSGSWTRSGTQSGASSSNSTVDTGAQGTRGGRGHHHGDHDN